MTDRLLICTDLDRTLIPNGPESESPGARAHFSSLAAHPAIVLTYVSGRHRSLVEKAIANYRLPTPDFVIGDVGTTIYQVARDHSWRRLQAWEQRIAADWNDHTHADLKSLLTDLPGLRIQERSKQNDYKLSYYVSLHSDRLLLSGAIRQRLDQHGIRARLIWSDDEPAGVGLLDVLPETASKYHAIEALMAMNGFTHSDTVFCGDSGNDIEVLVSPIPAVLVANAQPQVREQAQRGARAAGCSAQLYLAQGGFMGMNGNYSAGMLEGIAYYHPDVVAWMGFEQSVQNR